MFPRTWWGTPFGKNKAVLPTGLNLSFVTKSRLGEHVDWVKYGGV